MSKKNKIRIKDIPESVGSFTDSLAFSYLKRQSRNSDDHADTPEKRNSALKKIRRQTLFLSALYGALGVLILYIPQYIFPDIFRLSEYELPYVNYRLKFSVTELVYGFILVAIEIWLLTLLDLKAVGRVGKVFGFPPEKALSDFPDEGKELLYIGLGKEHKKFSEVGLNPYQRMSKLGVVLLLIVFRLKAFLSNFVFRMVLKRLLGRLAIRAVTDLAGIPIYAFWNAYASAIVIRKARMRMTADEMMRESGQVIYKKFGNNKEFKSLLYDSLEYIALTKKTYHITDYIFAKKMLKLFGVSIKQEHIISDNYLEKVKKASKETRKGIGKVLLIGFIIDGKIGSFEKRIIKKMQAEGIIRAPLDTIKIWTKNYAEGKGIKPILSDSAFTSAAG